MPLLLGRRGRRALPRGLLRHVPRRLAPWRLDRDHRPRHRDHHRPLGRDDQPRRHPHGHGRDLPRGAGGRRGHRRARRRRPARGRATTGCRCSWSCARARSSTTTLVERIRTRIREDCSPRHVPNEVIAVDEIPRTLSGKVLELPVKRILMGTPTRRRPRAATRWPNPEALDASSGGQLTAVSADAADARRRRAVLLERAGRPRDPRPARLRPEGRTSQARRCPSGPVRLGGGRTGLMAVVVARGGGRGANGLTDQDNRRGSADTTRPSPRCTAGSTAGRKPSAPAAANSAASVEATSSSR